MNKQLWIFDIEVYPNFFHAIFVDKDGHDERHFTIFQNTNESQQLIEFLEQEVSFLVGYNSTRYDDVILNLIRTGVSTPQTIHQLSEQIILDNYEAIKQYRWMDKPWTSIDLMAVIENNMNRTSLKAAAIHLKWHKIQDLPIPPGKMLSEAEATEIIPYCLNDVLITLSLFEELKPALTLRKNLSKEYGVDLLSASDSKIGKTVLEKMYGKPSVTETKRDIIKGEDLIPPTLDFQTPEFQQIRTAVKNLTLQGKHKFSAKLMYQGITFSIGLGGLHTEDDPGLFVSDNDHTLMDADVSSYYPSMILEYGIAPAHLDKEKFLTVYRQLVEERLEAKAAGDKTKADGVKITINAVFGMLRSKYFWLFDPLAFYKVTIGGQLLLLQLCESFFLAGIPVISGNTDGVICQVPKGKEELYKQVCQEWQEKTRLTLDYSTYKLYARSHVNGYVAVKDTGKVKVKGLFDPKLVINKFSLNKGYNSPVIALALQAWFIDGISPEEFIPNHPDVHDFLKTQKSGTGFALYERTIEGDTLLQKTNRYAVAKTGTALVKKHPDGRELSLLKKQTVWIANDITENHPPINYQYYIKEVRKIINPIDGTNQQMNLFDVPIQDGFEVIGEITETIPVVDPDITIALSVSNQRIGAGKIDKTSSTHKQEYHQLLNSFRNTTAAPDRIIQRIMEGWCIGPVVSGLPLCRENFNGLQMIALDFDTENEQSTIQFLSQHPIIKEYAYAIHSTPSHTQDAPRSRVLFFLDRMVRDKDKAALMLNSTYWRFGFGADQGVRNINRFWYGGKSDGDMLVLGNIMALADVKEVFVKPYLAHQKENEPVIPLNILAPDAVPQQRKEQHLSALCYGVSMAADGEKHFILYNTAYTLGGYIGGGYYTKLEVVERLRTAIKDNPNDVASLNSAYTTIDDGIKNGTERPLYYEAPPQQQSKAYKDGYVDGYSDKAVNLPPKYPLGDSIDQKLLEYYDCKWENRVVDEETGEIVSPGRLIIPFKGLEGNVVNEAHVSLDETTYAEQTPAIFHTDPDAFGQPSLVLADPVEAMTLYAGAEVKEYNILAATPGLYNYDGLVEDTGSNDVRIISWPGAPVVCSSCPTINLPAKPSLLSHNTVGDLMTQIV